MLTLVEAFWQIVPDTGVAVADGVPAPTTVTEVDDVVQLCESFVTT